MSGWDGGFGDSLTVEEVIRRKAPLFTQMARELGALADTQDLVQEASVAVWASLMRHPGLRDPLTWSTVVGRRAIQTAASRQKWTGSPSQQGGDRDPLRRDDRDSTDDENFTAHLAVAAADTFGGIELAYHRGEIARALAGLPQDLQAYVVLRFWGGLTNAEIGARLETTGPRVDRRWRDIGAPALRRELAHLSG